MRAADDLAEQRARLTRRVKDERLPVLVTVVACALLFVVGRAVGSAGQSSPAPWSPPRALPAATVTAAETDPPAIDDLRVPTPPAVHRRPRRTSHVGSGLAFAQSGSRTAATTPPAAIPQAPAAATTPSQQPPSAPPVSGKSGAGSSTPAHKQKQSGGSSGSFDSSG